MITNLGRLRAIADAAHQAVPARPGTRWHWSGDGSAQTIRLSAWVVGYGRCTVMDFDRWGMAGAEPRFSTDRVMRDARDMLVFEVGESTVRGIREARLDPSVYRYDVTGIDHPIATHVAAMDPETVLALIDRVEAAETALAAIGGVA